MVCLMLYGIWIFFKSWELSYGYGKLLRLDYLGFEKVVRKGNYGGEMGYVSGRVLRISLRVLCCCVIVCLMSFN